MVTIVPNLIDRQITIDLCVSLNSHNHTDRADKVINLLSYDAL